MRGAMMKLPLAGRLRAVALLGAVAVCLAGCVVYPSGYGGGYGYAPAYYAPAPAYYAPPVALDFDFGGGWGGGHRHWR